MGQPVFMVDLSVYKPPEEYKLNHNTGLANASRWSVSANRGFAGGWTQRGVARNAKDELRNRAVTGVARRKRLRAASCPALLQ